MSLWFAVLAAGLARHFPPLNTDEAFIANHGWNLIAGEGQRYSLYDDIFAPDMYSWRAAFAQVSETLTNGWIGLWLHVLGKDYWHARLACLSAGLFAFWLLCAITGRVGGPEAGNFCAVLLALDPVLYLACSVVRPETVLLAASSLIVWFILCIPSSFPWKRFIIGFMLSLLLAAHPNAAALWPGIFVFWIVMEPPEWPRFLAQSAAGFFAGILFMTGFVDLNLLRLSWQTFHVQLMRPPLLSWPWSPRDWLGNLVGKLYMDQTYYFLSDQAPGWSACLALKSVEWGLLFLGAAGGTMAAIRRHRSVQPEFALLMGTLMTWVSMGLLVRKQEVLYALNFYPFLVPMISLFLNGLKSRKAAVLFLMVPLVLFAHAVQLYQPLYASPTEIFRQLRVHVPDPHLKIVGPNFFWFDKDLDHFRDIGGLTYSHWYTGGQRDVGFWLRGWKPDILITDDTFNRLFVGPSPSALAHLLGVEVAPLGSVETGAGAYGILTLYRLDWSAHGT